MAAEGWGEPLQGMFYQRVATGALIGLIGIWIISSALHTSSEIVLKPQRQPLSETPIPEQPAEADPKLIVLPEFAADEPLGIRAARALLTAAAACKFKPRAADLSFLS
jgi:hypothetical protein